MAETTDEALMKAYVQGDEAAFRAIFERYAPVIFGMANRHLRNEDLAKDVTQQTFFRMHGARRDFRPDGRLRPWLLTIAMNLVRGHWRKSSRRKHVELEPEREAAPQPERGPIEVEQRATALREALQELPSSQREVVELHWFQERPYKEVAEIVGSSEGAVRVRAHRAYARLKELLGEVIA